MSVEISHLGFCAALFCAAWVILARRAFGRRDVSRRVALQPASRGWSLTATLEPLEARRVMAGVAAPVLAPIDDVVLLSGSPLHIPLNATDADGQPISFSAASDNGSLTTSVLVGNRSAVIRVAGQGEMVFELYENRAPRATSHFIQLVESGFYNGQFFDQVINGFSIGAGDPSGTGAGGSPLGAVDDQFHLDLQHNRTGVLSAGKDFDDSGDSRFLITEGDNRDLDFVQSIFGQLVAGEAVREAISNLPTDGNDRPLNPPRIESIEIIDDFENGVLMLKAPEGFTGLAEVTIVAMDPDGGTSEQTFTVDIQPDSFDSDPFLGDVPRLQTTVNTPVTFQLQYFDAEGDETIWFDDDLLLANGLPLPHATPAGLGYSIDGLTGLLTVTPSNGILGTYSFWVATGTRLSTFPGTPKEAFIDYQRVEIRITGVGEAAINVDTSLVHFPSATDTSGERNQVPASELWVDEFGEAWLEIWLTSHVSAQGVEGISLDVGFDSQRFAARDVVFGPGFSRNRAAQIDNQFGLVRNLRATTLRDDLGDDRPVLFARIRLEAIAEVPNSSADDYLRPESAPLFAVRESETPIVAGTTVALPAAENMAYFPVMYDLDDSGLIGFGDLALFSAAFLQPAGAGSGTFAADFDHSGRVGFGDLSLFSANFLKNRSAPGLLAYGNDFPAAWLADALMLDSASAMVASSLQSGELLPEEAELTWEALNQIVPTAIARLSVEFGSVDLDAAKRLSEIDFRIADLPGAQLGLYFSNTIWLDRDAAGQGWFIDPTPSDDSEFHFSLSTGSQTIESLAAQETAAALRVDLLTAVMHELGHALQLTHSQQLGESPHTGLMQGALPVGVRRAQF